MSTTSVTAANVMDSVSALMNDVAQSIFTYAVQTPYLRIACNELQEYCELNNIPSTNETAVVIEILAGVNRVVSQDDGTIGIPTYPSDLIDIQRIGERTSGTVDTFTPMSRFEFIPHWWETDPPISNLKAWAWMNQEIRFSINGAIANNDIKIDYIKTLFPQTITPNTVIGIINSQSFLSYRTAGLCSQYIGENPMRAGELNEEAIMSMDRLLGIGIKGKQAITIRRRPFMSGYKTRITDW